ncbi:MAG: replicative DNA helicase [SAR202 cluster bacterium]|jgi:replicative DNA helicase|nr:MAG: replicative DNA helicase [SAR202 cluster bacterium]KAA1299398.1 MAG: replicative DNA helicase [SAR202 cluster bacterium]MQF97212.1 replicative DNA helicase [SAR202 cluster bacterium]RZP16820.1 MAG: replicative DNA helicase [Chloroflexota bacterium]|tara:strand:+ start:30168 stop:31553 length:1386 start_codon:yes stop_codon:yes gene_type:complete
MVLSDKLFPHDISAEESVIGSLLLDGLSFTKIASFLEPEHFYLEPNRIIFEIARDLFNRQEPINQISIAHELETQEKLEDVGGRAYLAKVVDVVPTSIHIKHYANLVRRTATMRTLINAAENISEIGFDNDPDIENALSKAEDIIYSIRNDQPSRDFVPLRETLTPYLETSSSDLADDENRPISSGFKLLDDLLGGLQRSDMLVLAARPSVGKSMFALNLAINAAMNDQKVAIYSLEMGREQIATRMLATQARVNMHSLRMMRLSSSQENRLVDAIGRLSDLSIFIDDSPVQGVAEMRGKARRLQLEYGLDFIIVDYMQLISNNKGSRETNRAQEVSEISRQIKAMARDLRVPVIAISQLSRAIEHRQSHRPLLSDLRESGSIEQDADVVMFIHREEKFTTKEDWIKNNPGVPYPEGQAEIIVAKHRNGPTDTIPLAVDDSIGRFVTIDSARNNQLSTQEN